MRRQLDMKIHSDPPSGIRGPWPTTPTPYETKKQHSSIDKRGSDAITIARYERTQTYIVTYIVSRMAQATLIQRKREQDPGRRH